MQVNPLLLSLAVPAAAKTIDAAADAIRSASGSFADALSHSAPAIQADPIRVDQVRTDQSHQGDRFEMQLERFAQQFNSFLENNGIHGKFRLRMEVDPTGSVSAGTSGPRAEELTRLLRENPQWMNGLKQLALAGQAMKSSTSSGRAPHLSVQLTESGSSHWALL